MGLKRTVEPTDLFITLQEAKDHLRVEVTDDDSYISELIILARDHIETFVRRSLVTQTWEYALNEFPSGKIKLPMSPVQSVTDIKYIDAEGIEQTWANTEYDVFMNEMPGFVKLGFDKTYPTIRNTQDAIKITYVTGYSRRELIPRAIIHAGLLLIGHFYERREQTQVGGTIVEIPYGIETLLFPHRMFTP